MNKPKAMDVPIDSIKQHHNWALLSDLLSRYDSRCHIHRDTPPILLYLDTDGNYWIIDGHLRYKAAQVSGVQHISAIVIMTSFEGALLAYQIINADRLRITPLAETEMVVSFLAIVLGVAEAELRTIVHALARPRSNARFDQYRDALERYFSLLGTNMATFRSHRLYLLDLPEELWMLVGSGRLEPSKARAIARAEPAIRKDLIMAAEDGKLPSLRRLRKMILGGQQSD